MLMFGRKGIENALPDSLRNKSRGKIYDFGEESNLRNGQTLVIDTNTVPPKETLPGAWYHIKGVDLSSHLQYDLL